MSKLILAGGCFWGVEAYFVQLKGVNQTRVGYIDGNKPNPTYEEVCDGRANHAGEGEKQRFRPSIIVTNSMLIVKQETRFLRFECLVEFAQPRPRHSQRLVRPECGRQNRPRRTRHREVD